MPLLLDTIGLELHKRETQVCILTADGELVERRIATTRERFTVVLGSRPPARILVEASTESEGGARHLESMGQSGRASCRGREKSTGVRGVWTERRYRE